MKGYSSKLTFKVEIQSSAARMTEGAGSDKDSNKFQYLKNNSTVFKVESTASTAARNIEE